MKKEIVTVLIIMMFSSFLSAEDFGSMGALEKSSYQIEDMLKYALEDEYLALTEYNLLIEKFNFDRPYTNIIQSEQTHINYLKELYDSYDITLPQIDAIAFIYIPDTREEAAKIGLDAEIANIAMYEKFLKEDLPADIRKVFEFLKSASENHLKAFERQISGSRGNGQRKFG